MLHLLAFIVAVHFILKHEHLLPPGFIK